MASSANNRFIALNGTVGCKLCKSILPPELQVVVYEVPGLELKDGEEIKEHGPYTGARYFKANQQTNRKACLYTVSFKGSWM